MPEYKDTLRCRLYKDHKKLYEDLVHFEGMLELVKIEFRRILRESTTTNEIRDAQIFLYLSREFQVLCKLKS